MIVCLCPSPALDITYRVAALDVGATNRVADAGHRPGGKAVNVARVLHALGVDVVLVAPLGGASGEQVHAALLDTGLTVDVVRAGKPTRSTVTVVDAERHQATLLCEPAQVDCWPAVVAAFGARVASAETVVVSGSLPDGAPAGAISELVQRAHAHATPIVVDTSGPALADALTARPTIVKPNADELTELTGERDPVIAATRLARTHGVAVVASLGAQGLVAVDGTGCWSARPARPLNGNPTGAGDALVAGLALGLARGETLPQLLVEAVALSAAAVLQPRAGEVDPAEVAEQRTGATVTQLAVDGAR